MTELANLRNPKQVEFNQMQEELNKRRLLKEHAGRYKLIADLLAGKEGDLTLDPAIFAAMNQERMALERYMSFFKEECEETARYVQERQSTDIVKRKGNEAWWRYRGSLPNCVHRLFMRVAPNEDDRKKLRDRFFRNFPQFAYKETK